MKTKIYYNKGRTLISLDERAKSLFSFWNTNSVDVFSKKAEYDKLERSEKNFSTFPNYVFSDKDFNLIKKELSLSKEQDLIVITIDSGRRCAICNIYHQSKFNVDKKQFDFMRKQPKMSINSFLSLTVALSIVR